MIGLMHPKMLWLSLRPFLFVSIAWGILFFFIWEPTLEIIRVFITTSFLTAWIADVMSAAGWDEVRAVMAPLLLVMVLIPLITISLLVFVAFTSIPSVVKHLSKQAHYQSLHQANAGGVWGSISYALISTFICFFFLLITLPIWWIPPMVAILAFIRYGDYFWYVGCCAHIFLGNICDGDDFLPDCFFLRPVDLFFGFYFFSTLVCPLFIECIA
jgi:hypothetical protein